jgi:hypothetical protein
VRREICDQCIAADNGKPSWSMKAFIRTVRKIKHHDVVSPGVFAFEFRDKCPQEWTIQSLKTLEEATESDMVDVIGEASF